MLDGLPVDCDRRLRRLADYLASKAPPGMLPGRQHIDPAEIPDLIAYLTLTDVVQQATGIPRYRIRLCGTEVVRILGVDGTGKFVDEVLTTSDGAEVIEAYSEILNTRKPQYLDGVLRTKGREHIPFQRIAFPLARNGVDIDMLVFMFVQVPYVSAGVNSVRNVSNPGLRVG